VKTLSNYTTQVRNIIENCSVDNLTLSNNEKIEIGRSFIFDFPYPIWNENYKKDLETKIIKHYYTKEIGLETVGLWKFYLEERLNLIMPYYNNIYATTIKDYDYLTNINTTETFENDKTTHDIGTIDNTVDLTKTDTGGGTQTVNGTDTSKSLESDAPQANYAGLDYASKLNDTTDTKNDTVTTDNNNTTTNTGTNNTTNDNTSTTNDNYTKTNKGNSGSKSFTELILEYRESLINIDSMIIDELKDLFMSIY
jgi:hypothetical protein